MQTAPCSNYVLAAMPAPVLKSLRCEEALTSVRTTLLAKGRCMKHISVPSPDPIFSDEKEEIFAFQQKRRKPEAALCGDRFPHRSSPSQFSRCPFVFGARFCTTGARTYGDESLVTNRTAGFFTFLVPIWSEWCAKYAKTASHGTGGLHSSLPVNPGTAAIATTCMTCGGNGGFVAHQRFSKGDYLAVKSIS